MPALEVRFESIGGLGAHLAAQLLAEALLARRSTLAGLKPEGVLVINRPRASTRPLPCAHVFLVDAMAIAVEERTRINTAILGAVAKACALIDAKALLRLTVEKTGSSITTPPARSSNLIEAAEACP